MRYARSHGSAHASLSLDVSVAATPIPRPKPISPYITPTCIVSVVAVSVEMSLVAAPQVIPVRLCRRLSRTELRDGRPLPRLAVPSRRHVRPPRRRLLVPLRHRVPGSRLSARDAVQRARQALLQRRRVPATTGVAPGRRRGVGTVTGRDVRPARRVLLRLSAGILGRSLPGLRPVLQRKRVCQRRNVSGRTAEIYLLISLNVLAMCSVVSFASL